MHQPVGSRQKIIDVVRNIIGFRGTSAPIPIYVLPEIIKVYVYVLVDFVWCIANPHSKAKNKILLKKLFN